MSTPSAHLGAFERMRGTVSFPFQPGEHRRVAVEVTDSLGKMKWWGCYLYSLKGTPPVPISQC